MNIVDIAKSELGVEEIPDGEHNPRILEYARETGMGFIEDDETPWCSTFLNWWAMKAGLPMSGRPNARSWLDVGRPTQYPEAGDVVVFWRESPNSWKGHVGIFMGFNEDCSKVYSLGGNQNNKVSIAEYSIGRVLSYQRIDERLSIPSPDPLLERGSEGSEVRKLQLALNRLGYYYANIDGDFGPITEAALRSLQTDHLLKVDGIYGNESKQCIASLLQS